MENIYLSKPQLGREEEKAVMKVLRSGQLAQGTIVEIFEKNFAEFIGVKHALSTSNGTTALHLALMATGIGSGDEVITTPFSFIASSNAILHIGAKPVFVDIDYDTYNINPSLIENKITKRTKAILPVHLYGLPANMKAIMNLAKKYKLQVIEDACQSHGADIGGKKTGAMGLAGCFSFYPTKNITSGEGGMITTNDSTLAERIKLLRDHGMKIRYHHEIIGYNFRMTNIAAAIGIEQLKKLKRFNQKRIQNAKLLSKTLSKIPGIIIPAIPDNYAHVFHQYTIKVTKDFKLSRDSLADYLKKNGISTGIYYPIPIHKQKPYIELGYGDKLPVTEQVAKEVISLPIHPGLKNAELKKITIAFEKVNTNYCHGQTRNATLIW